MLQGMEAWAAGADPSFVRHFVFAILAIAAPPFSATFASSLIRCAIWQEEGLVRIAELYHFDKQKICRTASKKHHGTPYLTVASDDSQYCSALTCLH